MKAHETLLAAHRALALRPVGIDPTYSRVTESQVGALFATAEILRLPPSVAPAQQDPVSGALFFSIGQSELGSSDPLT